MSEIKELKFDGHSTLTVDHFIGFLEECLKSHEQGALADGIVDIVIKAVRAIQEDWEKEFVEERR